MSTESPSGTFGQTSSPSRGGGYAEETLWLVEQKSDFEAVPDQNHSGAVIPIWIWCSRDLDDFMHAGENCCL